MQAAPAERAQQQEQAHGDQVGRQRQFHPDRRHMADHVHANRGADGARNDQRPEQPAQHIASHQMTDAGGAARKGFRVVHAGACQRRRHAQRQQQCCGGDAIGHAQGAIDQLGHRADQG